MAERPRRWSLVPFTLAVLGWLWCCTAAQADPAPPAAVVPIEQSVAVASDESARLSVPVTIGDRTWHFLIDSASTRTVIASDVADSMALTGGQPLQIVTIAGLESVPSVIIPELGFSSFAARDIKAPALARANLGGDGLLGLDILRNNRVAIDFRHATALTIAPSSHKLPPSESAHDDDPDTIVVKARSRMGQLIVTDAVIDGITVAVIIDTGAQDSIGSPALARMLFHGARRASLAQATLVGVTGRTLPADYAQIGKLQIGGVTIANLPMAFADVASFRQFGLIRRPAVLLGMKTLRLFAQVTIDFPRRQISFLLRDS